VLSVGSRKSECFTRLFQNDNFQESQSRTSHVDLHEIAADAFPAMLDHVCKQTSELIIDTKTAVSLHHLGQNFEIWRLRWEVKQFWQNDLDLSNCHVYHEHACIFQDDKVLKAVAGLCATEIFEITPKCRILEVAGPQFWLALLEKADITEEFSLHVSTLVAEVVSKNKDMETEIFRNLTDEKYLFKIDFDAARRLLEIECKIVNLDGATELTNLQERCAESLSGNWEQLQVTHKPTMDFLRKQNPSVLTEILSKVLTRAGDALSESRAELGVVNAELQRFKPVPPTKFGMDISIDNPPSRPESDKSSGVAACYRLRWLSMIFNKPVYYYDYD
jgi:hypothetical protein